MTQESSHNVGLRLRAFRERQGWSLRTLSNRCGLSINAISRIERGENSPTISSLNRLATALAIPITDFFVERPKQSAIFIKSGSGERFQVPGYEVEHLGNGLSNQQLEPFLVKVEAGYDSAAAPINHPGDEFVHCLEGEVEYCINDQVFSLRAGDSLLFEAMQYHSWRNVSGQPALLLLVFQAALDNSLARQRHQTG